MCLGGVLAQASGSIANPSVLSQGAWVCGVAAASPAAVPHLSAVTRHGRCRRSWPARLLGMWAAGLVWEATPVQVNGRTRWTWCGLAAGRGRFALFRYCQCAGRPRGRRHFAAAGLGAFILRLRERIEKGAWVVCAGRAVRVGSALCNTFGLLTSQTSYRRDPMNHNNRPIPDAQVPMERMPMPRPPTK